MRKRHHTDEERVWTGHPLKHPDEVWDVFHAHGYVKKIWDTFEILCDEPMCIQFDHFKLVRPRRLEYPGSLCTYCGVHSHGRDHLIPWTKSGSAERRVVLTVPACGQCNSILGDVGIHTIDGRREHVQKRLARKKLKVLGYQKLTPSELAEFGPGLRPMMANAITQREHLEARLLWPDDPHYDIRYLQKSGYHEPMAVGLLDHKPEDAMKAREENLLSAQREALRRRKG